MSLRRIFPELQREINRFIRSIDEPFIAHRNGFPSIFSPIIDSRTPIVDLHDTPKDYIIEAELPGVKGENIDIQCIDDKTITLQGKYSGSKEYTNNNDMKADKPIEGEIVKKDDSTLYQGERWHGSFNRSFTFPTPIDTDSIKASYKNGLLSIKIPKISKKTVQVKIQDSD